MIRIQNVLLYSGEESFSNGCCLIDGDRILFAGDRADCPEAGACQVLDGRGGILMPGFYNAHSHAAMTLMRGVGSDLMLMDWLHQVFPIEDKLTESCVYWGSKLAVQEMLRHGVLGFADMYFFMDEVGKLAVETGIRANLVRGCTSEEGIASNEALFREFDGAGNGLVRVYMGLHSEYLTETPLARKAIESAKKLGTGMHIHMSETKGETEGSIERRGMTPPAYFDSLGAFDVPVIAAHCVHATDADIDILAEKGAFVAHNPASNLKLASGIAPIAKMLEKGVHVALGSDGPSSANRFDMIDDMRMASFLQKGTLGDPTVMNAAASIHMATREGALAMGFADAGLIKAGMKADMILLDGELENLSFMTDIPSAVVYAAQGSDVKMSMVDGKILYWNGEFPAFDASETIRKAKEAAVQLGVKLL